MYIYALSPWVWRQTHRHEHICTYLHLRQHGRTPSAVRFWTHYGRISSTIGSPRRLHSRYRRASDIWAPATKKFASHDLQKRSAFLLDCGRGLVLAHTEIAIKNQRVHVALCRVFMCVYSEWRLFMFVYGEWRLFMCVYSEWRRFMCVYSEWRLFMGVYSESSLTSAHTYSLIFTCIWLRKVTTPTRKHT